MFELIIFVVLALLPLAGFYAGRANGREYQRHVSAAVVVAALTQEVIDARQATVLKRALERAR